MYSCPPCEWDVHAICPRPTPSPSASPLPAPPAPPAPAPAPAPTPATPVAASVAAPKPALAPKLTPAAPVPVPALAPPADPLQGAQGGLLDVIRKLLVERGTPEPAKHRGQVLPRVEQNDLAPKY